MDELHKQPVPITARDIARIFRRRAPVALVTFVLIVVGVLAVTRRMKPVWEASASLLMDTPSSGNGISGGLLAFLGQGATSPSLDTEIEKIHSRKFLNEVIRNCSLKNMTPEDLKGRLTLSTGPGGQILIVTVRARTAIEAQTTANGVAQTYINEAQEEFVQKTSLSEERLREVRDQSKQDKEKAEAALHQFTAHIGLSDPEILYSTQARKTVDLQNTLDDEKKSLPLMTASLQNLQAQISKVPKNLETGYALNKNPLIDSYHTDIQSLETHRNDLLLDYTPDSFEVTEVNKQIADKQQMLQQIQSNKDIYSVGSKGMSRSGDYSNFQSQIYNTQIGIKRTRQNISADEKQLATLQGEEKQMSQDKLTWEDLSTKREFLNGDYEKAVQGLLQMEESRLTSKPDIRFLDAAQLPPAPISPKPMLNMIMAVSLGLVLGAGAALAAEYIAGGFDAPPISHLPEVGGVPLLGLLPAALPAPLSIGSDARATDLPVPLSGIAPHAMARGAREIAAIEDVLREIGYCLAHRQAGQPAPVVLLTSVRGDESTAALAAQLTATLVRDGLRVTLIDADRVHPRLNRVFGAPDAPGLADVLAGRASVRDILHVGADGALRFLAAGSPKDAALPTAAGLKAVFKELASETDTDVVFVSGPSVWNVRQIMPLEKAAEGMVLLTFADGGSPAESVARARRLLSNGYKPEIRGVVIGQTLGRNGDGIHSLTDGSDSSDSSDSMNAVSPMIESEVAS